MTNETAAALRARYLLPIDGEPIAGGVVTIVGERIVAVGRSSDAPVVDLGDVAITPGLVNAHTHLEFSWLTSPLPTNNGSMVDWIRAVIAARQAATASATESATTSADRAIEHGLSESLAAGVTAIGEIDTGGWNADIQSNCQMVVFRESIALTATRIAAEVAQAREFLTVAAKPTLVRGLSPHAPYTAHPRLVAELVALASAHGAPVAMHLAESWEELELLRQGRGPLRELLTERGIWPDGVFGDRRPLDELRRLAQAPRALVIHGNHFDAEEIAFLSEHRDSMTLVFCPRTHRHFGRPRHPVDQMLAAGAEVALGTDSRASNPDLSLLSELQAVVADGYHASPRRLLKMITKIPARALGLSDSGTLASGQLANLAVIRLPPAGVSADPHELLCDSRSRVVQTWLRGRPLEFTARSRLTESH